MFTKALLFWVVLAALGVINGAIRQLGYGPYMSEAAAHAVSCFALIALIVAAVGWFTRRHASAVPPRVAARIGVLWVVLTVVFEFGFGHWVVGDSWESLLAAYNVFAGRLWVLVPLAMVLAPWLWARHFQVAASSRTLPRRASDAAR